MGKLKTIVATVVALAVWITASQAAAAPLVSAKAKSAVTFEITAAQQATGGTRLPRLTQATLICQYDPVNPGSGGTCTASFPHFLGNHRFDVQFVSCRISSTHADTQLGTAFFNPTGGSVSHALPWDARTATGLSAPYLFELSQPIVLSITANKTATIRVDYVGHDPNEGECTLSGEFFSP